MKIFVYLSVFIAVFFSFGCIKEYGKKDIVKEEIEFKSDTIEIKRDFIVSNIISCGLDYNTYNVKLISKPDWITTNGMDEFILKGIISQNRKSLSFRHNIAQAPVPSIAWGEVVYETSLGLRGFTVKAIY